MSTSATSVDFDQDVLAGRAPTLAHLFERRVAETPDHEAFRRPVGEVWESFTWSQMHHQAMSLAAGLISLGVRPQERVAIASSTRYEWVLADLAVILAGAATTTIYPTTGSSDVGYILADSESRVVFAENGEQVAKISQHRDQLPQLLRVVVMDGPADADWLLSFTGLQALGEKLLREQPNVLADVRESLGPESLATLIYTSGTTGRPKGVRLSHSALSYEVATIDSIRTLSIDDLQYLWLPLAHVFGKLMIALPLQIGFATAVDGRVDRIVANLPNVKPTFMGAAPRIFEKVYAGVNATVAEDGGLKAKIFDWAIRVGTRAARLRRSGASVPLLLAAEHTIADRLVLSKIRERFGGRVRFFVSGSAALNPDIAEWFDGVGIKILEGYGLTESAAASFCNRPGDYVIGTVGHTYPGTEAKIADDGEILLRGPGLMEGYHNLPEATAEAIDEEGWLHTGDIGTIDERGFLRITDRKKDLFKTSGGKYVAPSVIESQFKGVCPLASQLIVYGNNRNFVSALITLDPDAVQRWGAAAELSEKSYADIVGSAPMRIAIQGYVDQLNAQLNPWETIKRFVILDHDLTVEAGELTPSLKLRRAFVSRKYADRLESLYS